MTVSIKLALFAALVGMLGARLLSGSLAGSERLGRAGRYALIAPTVAVSANVAT